MSFLDIVKKRRSVRSYLEKPVPEDVLLRILESARLAPSASNRQAWKFIVVKDPELRNALSVAANNQRFVGQAPVVIAAVALMPEGLMSCGVPRYAVDLSIAVTHMTLAAAAEGLGTCWIGAFSQEKAKELLQVPDEYKVVALLPLGYPADNGVGGKSRKPLDEIVSYNKFS